MNLRSIVLALALIMLPIAASAQVLGGGGLGVSGGGGSGGGASTTQGIGGGASNSPGADSVVNVKNYGAKGDGKIAYDGAMTSTIGYAQGSSVSPQAPATTTSVANDEVVYIIGDFSLNLTPPASPTSRVNLLGTASLYGVYGGDLVQATAGSVAAQTGSQTSADWTALTIPLACKGGGCTFIGVNTCAVTSTNACNITTPASAAAGDTALVCDLIFSNVNIPAGAATTAAYTLGSKVTAGHQSIYCYEHTVTASEPATQVFSANASVGQTGIELVYRNVAGFDNPLTSASASFTTADATANKAICMTGTAATNTTHANAGCGTIGLQVSGTSVITSIPNITGGSISSQEYRYATVDDTAYSSAVTALTNQNGGTLFMPAGMYGRTNCTVLPATAAVNMLGSGGGPNNSNLSDNATLTTQTTSWLMLTKLATCGAAIQMKTAAGHPQQLYGNRLQDFTIAAGAGNADEVGFGGDGIDIVNWMHALIEHVGVMGFSGDGILIDVPVGGTGADGAINNAVEDSFIIANNVGLQIGSTTGGGLIESTIIKNDVIQGSWLNGVELDSSTETTDTTSFIGGTIQWNNRSTTAGGDEINIPSPSEIGCVFSGIHIETTYANTQSVIESPVSASTVQGCNWHNNYFVGDIGGLTSFTIGKDSTHLISSATVEGNQWNSAWSVFVVHNTVNSRAKSNNANGTEVTWSDSPWSPNWSGAANAVVSNSVANVFPISGVGTAVATTSEGTVSIISPVVATARNLKCTLTNAAGTATVAGGTNYVLALRQNLASSASTCTITAAISTCADNTHSIPIAIGDQLDVIDTPTGTPTALIPHCSVELDY